MEVAQISDDSNNSEMKMIKDQLSEFGLDEENLSKEEMYDLLAALNNSKSTVNEEELPRQKVDESPPTTVQRKCLKRRYKNVKDRRLPWSLFPNTLTNAEKARVLAAYLKLVSVRKYWQARQSVNFAAWPLPIQITEETNTRSLSLRSTRSGRNVPVYSYDEDSSDADFIVAKPKRRKMSGSENNDGLYINKVVSLKRRGSKDETRPTKEIKVSEDFKVEASTSTYRLKSKDCFEFED